MSFSLTPSRRPHALKPDCGFVPPPLDGSLSLTQIYDFHYRHNTNYTVFIHPTASGEQVDVTYKDVVPAIHQAARLTAEIAGVDIEARLENIPAIAVLAASGKLLHYLFQVGCLDLLSRHDILYYHSPRNNASWDPCLPHRSALFGSGCGCTYFQERYFPHLNQPRALYARIGRGWPGAIQN